MKQKNEKDLLFHKIISGLRCCGHFLYFRMGGRAGHRRIFFALLEHGELQQRQLQDILGVRSGSLSEILAKMESHGLIDKIKNNKDRRNYNLKLTKKGVESAIQMQALYDEKIKQLLSCFTDSQAEDFLSMLNILLEHWNNMERDGLLAISEYSEIDLDKNNEEVKAND